MQRAAARLASVSLRRLAAPTQPGVVAPLLIPAASVVHATARSILLQPTTAAALFARRWYARRVNCDDDSMESEEEEMLSDFDPEGDFDDEDADDLDDDDDEEDDE